MHTHTQQNTQMSDTVSASQSSQPSDALLLRHDEETGETLTDETRSEEEEPTEEDKAFIDEACEVNGAIGSADALPGSEDEHSASDDETEEEVEEAEEGDPVAEGPSSSGRPRAASKKVPIVTEPDDSDEDYVETDEDGHPLLTEKEYLHWATGFVQGVRRMRRHLYKLILSAADGDKEPSLADLVRDAAEKAFADGDLAEEEFGPDLCLEGDDE